MTPTTRQAARSQHRHYCTYFDRNYLVKGIALIESLRLHESSPFTIYVVCYDEITREVLSALHYPEVVTIPIHDVLRNDPSLRRLQDSRTFVEFLWTATSSIILHLLRDNRDIETLCYLDADLYFASSPTPLYEELDSSQASILIHEHRFVPELKAFEAHGRFNVGLLLFRNDSRAERALSWWRERCLEWCFNRVEDGKHGDQGYLTDWPSRFEGVHVLQHLGGGLAPWNQGQYTYSWVRVGVGTHREGSVLGVNGAPLVFYHFHAFTLLSPAVVLPCPDTRYRIPLEVVVGCYIPYLEDLRSITERVIAMCDGFLSGIHNPHHEITAGQSLLIHRSVLSEFRALSLPHRDISVHSEWTMFASEQCIIPIGSSMFSDEAVAR